VRQVGYYQELTLNCGVTWASAERVNLCNRQTTILLRQTKTYAT